MREIRVTRIRVYVIEQHLRAADVARIMGVSRSRSYEILAECTRVLTGKRGVRVSETAFRRWLERRTIAPACEYTNAADGTTSAMANIGGRCTRKTRKKRGAEPSYSGENFKIRTIVPRTKPR